MSDLIRTGIIRCDMHGMWFGAQMDEHDPLRLREPMPVENDMSYTWQRGGTHYFYYTKYSEPTRMTAPSVDGFRIVKVWDEQRRNAEMFSNVFYGRPEVCDSFEQVSDDVDLVLIANCNYDGSDHLELARPGLEKGVPTFIDKPFAHCIADVRAILELANANNAPVMSLSMLQTNPAVVRLVRRLDEVGRVTFGTITCASTHLAALIHAISIAHHVFGTGIRSVSCLKAPNHTVYHLHYGDAPGRPEHGVVVNCGVADFRFTEMFTHVFGPEGAIQGLVLNDFNACEGSAIILEYVRDMVRTGRPHPLGDDMVAAVAVSDAIRKAEKTGKSVDVEIPFR